MSVDPKAPVLRSANYDESATFGDLTAVFKYMVENHVRYALTSPPLLKDVPEGCIVYDKTLKRIYITANGALVYFQGT
jgi:hypothetical protein